MKDWFIISLAFTKLGLYLHICMCVSNISELVRLIVSVDSRSTAAIVLVRSSLEEKSGTEIWRWFVPVLHKLSLISPSSCSATIRISTSEFSSSDTLDASTDNLSHERSAQVLKIPHEGHYSTKVSHCRTRPGGDIVVPRITVKTLPFSLIQLVLNLPLS